MFHFIDWSSVVVSFFFFFFFKQKTAYEMRISDWSSDVCSSDLVGHRAGRGDAGEGRRAGPGADAAICLVLLHSHCASFEAPGRAAPGRAPQDEVDLDRKSVV